MTEKIKITFATTGHRPDKLGGYSNEAQDLLYSFADFLVVNILSFKGINPKFISGMAIGWDQAVASACIKNDVPFIAAIPFEGQEGMWPHESKLKYDNLLEKAEDVIYVNDPGYKPWKMQKRNEWMVDNSDRLLALWDGSAGGTSNCVKYAEKRERPTLHLWDVWEHFKIERI